MAVPGYTPAVVGQYVSQPVATVYVHDARVYPATTASVRGGKKRYQGDTVLLAQLTAALLPIRFVPAERLAHRVRYDRANWGILFCQREYKRQMRREISYIRIERGSLKRETEGQN